LGWDHLREIGTKSPIDFSVELEKYRASTGNNAADIPEPTRCKLLAACEILKNGGSLEELRLIGYAHPSDFVNFSVGQHRFTCLRATLCRVKGSHLENLFSGRHDNSMVRNPRTGEYHIDRVGRYFEYILEYLQNGTIVALPGSSMDNIATEEWRNGLAAEADFYGLPDLVRTLLGPFVWTAQFLSDQTLGIQKLEHQLRLQLFPNNDGIGGDFTDILIPLFNPRDRGHYNCPIRFKDEFGIGKDEVASVLATADRSSRTTKRSPSRPRKCSYQASIDSTSTCCNASVVFSAKNRWS
jgi:hypothetical protein